MLPSRQPSLINRPSVAGAVHWFIHSFHRSSLCLESSSHCLFQTVRARELIFWENDHPLPSVRCQVSGLSLFFFKVIELVGGGSFINRAYPVLFLIAHCNNTQWPWHCFVSMDIIFFGFKPKYSQWILESHFI